MSGWLISLACLLLADGDTPPERREERVREITVREAIELGLAYNLGLKNARLDALIARFDVEAADAAWDPTLTTDVGLTEQLIPSRTQLAGANVVDTDNYNFALGVTQPFRVGPTLGLTWRTDRTFNNSTFATINPAYDTALDLQLMVPLLRGRGRSAQEADLRSTQAAAQGARYLLVDEAMGLIDEVASGYWALLALQERVRVLQKSVDVAREIEDTERRKARPEIGRSTQLDVTTAKAETKRRETALIQGRLDAANASDDLRLLVLPFTGGPDDNVVLVAVMTPKDLGAIPPLDHLVETALARRPDLKAADTEISRMQEGVVKARDQLRVQLDLGAGVTWRGVDGDFTGSAEQTLRGDFPSVGATLNLVWTMGRRAARAALRRAEVDLEKARLDRREQVNGAVVEVRKAHRQLLTSLEEIKATREEVAAAAAALEGERLRLQRGSSTVLDVARLEENLTEAQLRLLQARAILAQARVTILRVTGTLLEEFGLELGPDLHVRYASDAP
ncbi:MAG: TolC family protein [Planctomycetota bacterium]